MGRPDHAEKSELEQTERDGDAFDAAVGAGENDQQQRDRGETPNPLVSLGDMLKLPAAPPKRPRERPSSVPKK